MATNTSTTPDAEPNGQIGTLLQRISEDVKTLARDEVELVRTELAHTARTAAAEAAIVVLGAIVALVGFAMLCVAAVVALAPVIPALWLRLVLMAFVYLIAGGSISGAFGRRLSHDAVPHLAVPAYEARRTLAGAKESLQHS